MTHTSLRLYTEDELATLAVSWMMRELLFYPFDLFSYKNMDFGGARSVRLAGDETYREVAQDPLFGVKVSWRLAPKGVILDRSDGAQAALAAWERKWRTEITFDLSGVSKGALGLTRPQVSSYLAYGIAHSEVGVGVDPKDAIIYPRSRMPMQVSKIWNDLTMGGWWRRTHAGVLGSAPGGIYGWGVRLWTEQGLEIG